MDLHRLLGDQSAERQLQRGPAVDQCRTGDRESRQRGVRAAASPGAPTLSPFSSAQSATNTTWTWSLTASATGGLPYDPIDVSQSGTLTLTIPPSASRTQSSYATVYDLTTGNAAVNRFVTYDSGGHTLTVSQMTFPVSPGDVVLVQLAGLTNPTPGPLSGVSISTSADTTPTAVTSPGSFVATAPVSGVSVAPTTTAAAATGVTWAVHFTASATGGLFARYAGSQSPRLRTVFSNNCYLYTIFDLTTGQSGNCLQPQVTRELGGAPPEPGDRQSRDDVEIVAVNTTNPPSGDFDATTVATSSDSAAAGRDVAGDPGEPGGKPHPGPGQPSRVGLRRELAGELQCQFYRHPGVGPEHHHHPGTDGHDSPGRDREQLLRLHARGPDHRLHRGLPFLRGRRRRHDHHRVGPCRLLVEPLGRRPAPIVGAERHQPAGRTLFSVAHGTDHLGHRVGRRAA